MKTNKEFVPDTFRKINQTFSDFFYEKQRACGIDEISQATGLSRPKVNEYIQKLLGQKQIHEIYSGKGVPTLYIPAHTIKDLMKLEPKPAWSKSYGFNQKETINKQIENSKKEIERYDSFERLLYSHDKALEKALAISFEFLQFDNVVYTDNSESHDVEFFYKDCLYLVEAKGKSGQADKVDVLQLRGWIDTKLDDGYQSNKLRGILIVNSHRHIEPIKRKENPFTDKAKEFLKMNQFIYCSTFFIYKIITQIIENKITLEEAKEQIIIGEKLDK